MYKIVGVYMDIETGEKLNLEMKFKHDMSFYRLVGWLSSETTMWFSGEMMGRFLGSGLVVAVEEGEEHLIETEAVLKEVIDKYIVDMREKGVNDVYLFPCFCASLARGEMFTTLSVNKTLEIAIDKLVKGIK